MAVSTSSASRAISAVAVLLVYILCDMLDPISQIRQRAPTVISFNLRGLRLRCTNTLPEVVATIRC